MSEKKQSIPLSGAEENIFISQNQEIDSINKYLTEKYFEDLRHLIGETFYADIDEGRDGLDAIDLDERSKLFPEEFMIDDLPGESPIHFADNPKLTAWFDFVESGRLADAGIRNDLHFGVRIITTEVPNVDNPKLFDEIIEGFQIIIADEASAIGGGIIGAEPDPSLGTGQGFGRSSAVEGGTDKTVWIELEPVKNLDDMEYVTRGTWKHNIIIEDIYPQYTRSRMDIWSGNLPAVSFTDEIMEDGTNRIKFLSEKGALGDSTREDLKLQMSFMTDEELGLAAEFPTEANIDKAVDNVSQFIEVEDTPTNVVDDIPEGITDNWVDNLGKTTTSFIDNLPLENVVKNRVKNLVAKKSAQATTPGGLMDAVDVWELSVLGLMAAAVAFKEYDEIPSIIINKAVNMFNSMTSFYGIPPVSKIGYDLDYEYITKVLDTGEKYMPTDIIIKKVLMQV